MHRHDDAIHDGGNLEGASLQRNRFLAEEKWLAFTFTQRVDEARGAGDLRRTSASGTDVDARSGKEWQPVSGAGPVRPRAGAHPLEGADDRPEMTAASCAD